MMTRIMAIPIDVFILNLIISCKINNVITITADIAPIKAFSFTIRDDTNNMVQNSSAKRDIIRSINPAIEGSIVFEISSTAIARIISLTKAEIETIFFSLFSIMKSFLKKIRKQNP